MKPRPIITFTSDFGLQDHYVSAVKGSILWINPEVKVIDTSHELTPHDILSGAFCLSSCYSYFPAGTIHLVVVDPGVGSSRRGLVVSTDRFFFVAPDNGVLSSIFAREELREVVAISEERYFRHPVSATFHGRDIFGPVAAWLAKGVELADFGPSVDDYQRLSLFETEVDDWSITGTVIHIDRFGNVITSLDEDTVQGAGPVTDSSYIQIEGHKIDLHARFYAEGPENRLFFLLGSSGYYEVAGHSQSAAAHLGIQTGAKVTLVF